MAEIEIIIVFAVILALVVFIVVVILGIIGVKFLLGRTYRRGPSVDTQNGVDIERGDAHGDGHVTDEHGDATDEHEGDSD